MFSTGILVPSLFFNWEHKNIDCQMQDYGACVYIVNSTEIIIKLCCYLIRSIRSPRGVKVGQPCPLTPQRRFGGTYHVTTQFYFYPVMSKIKKFNQYLPMLLTLLNVSDSRFRKIVMFWMWRHHDMALWHHGGGAWHNDLILMTASIGNSWADIANHVPPLLQAGDTENFKCRITGKLLAISCSRTAQSYITVLL